MATVDLACSPASINIKARVFLTPRAPYQMLYWSLSSVYVALGMTSFKKTPSKWAWNFERQWGPTFEAMSKAPQVCQGTYVNTDPERKAQLQESSRCLQSASASTVSLLSALSFCSFAVKQKGGVSEPEVRAHSRQLLSRFLAGGTSQLTAPTPMFVIPSAEWAAAWPRPVSTDMKSVAIRVEVYPNGFLNFGGLQRFVDEHPRCRLCATWWQVASAIVDSNNRCPHLRLH